jgi:hypothetical protein
MKEGRSGNWTLDLPWYLLQHKFRFEKQHIAPISDHHSLFGSGNKRIKRKGLFINPDFFNITQFCRNNVLGGKKAMPPYLCRHLSVSFPWDFNPWCAMENNEIVICKWLINLRSAMQNHFLKAVRYRTFTISEWIELNKDRWWSFFYGQEKIQGNSHQTQPGSQGTPSRLTFANIRIESSKLATFRWMTGWDREGVR